MKHTEGRIEGISLITFLQMVEHEKTTCTVTARENGETGRLHFDQGLLVDAEQGGLLGTEAAYRIIRWRDPEIEFADKLDIAPRPRRIFRPLIAIILDAHKLLDETNRLVAPSDRPASKESTEQEAPGPAQQRERHMNTLPQLLTRFRDEVPEFVSTDIVNVDSGLSISGASIDPNFDGSVASACSAEVVKANRRALELLGLGADSTEDILICTAKVYLLMRMLGPDYYHVLAVNRKGNLGLARAIMKKHQPMLLRAIGELTPA